MESWLKLHRTGNIPWWPPPYTLWLWLWLRPSIRAGWKGGEAPVPAGRPPSTGPPRSALLPPEDWSCGRLAAARLRWLEAANLGLASRVWVGNSWQPSTQEVVEKDCSPLPTVRQTNPRIRRGIPALLHRRQGHRIAPLLASHGSASQPGPACCPPIFFTQFHKASMSAGWF